MLKAKQMFFKYFYDNKIKIFSCLKTVVILAADCDFFSAKCVQLPLAFKE